MRAHVVLMTVAALAGRRFAHAGCPITPQAQPTKVQLVTSTPPYSSPYRRAVTFSPDGRYLAIASVDLGMTLWDARTRRPIWTLPFPGGEVAWGADALFAIDEAARTTTRIALADHASSVEHVLRYPMASGSLVIEGERVELRDASDRRTRSLAWPGSARRLASVVVGNDGTVAGIAATVDAESQRLVGGKQLIVWDPTGRGREVAMPSSAWKLALRMGRIFIQGDQLQIFDLAASTFTAGPDRLGRDIAISPTGDRVAYPMGVTVVGQRNPVWEAMPELVRATNSVAFDPSGRMIAFSGTHRVLLVDAATGHTIAKLGPERDLLRATFFDDRTLVTRHGDLISTWDLTSGALDQARSRIVRADSLGVVGGDLLVARLSERRPYNCSPIYIDRWSKGVPPKDLDAAVEGEAPSFEPVTDKPPAVPQGAAKAPYCAAEFTRFEHVDFARLRGLVHPSNQNYRWMDLGGGNEVVLAGSDKLGYKGDVGTDNTVAGIVDGKLLMWSPTGERSELALPAVPDNAPIQWSPPIEIDATRVAVGYGANLVLAQRGGASRTVKTDALPEGISFAGSAVIVRMGDGTLRRYGFDGVEQKRVSIGTPTSATSPRSRRMASAA